MKLVLFESLGAVSYLSSIVIMAVSVAAGEIFSVKEWCDLEIGVRGGFSLSSLLFHAGQAAIKLPSAEA